jgi:signal transduction histidine kinase
VAEQKYVKHFFRQDTMSRLLGSFIVSLVVAVIFSYFNYSNYWFVTIYRTQTVDFNILANLLPAKLSMALSRNDLEEVHRTLDSNYGLFGIAVTDCKLETKKCPSQKVVAYSWENKATNFRWQANLTPESLGSNYYDVLRDVPPDTAEWGYESSSSLQGQEKLTNRKNFGHVIGRVYYIRGIPPTFFKSFQKWIFAPFRNSSSFNYFSNIFLLSFLNWIALSLAVETAFYQTSIQNEKLVSEQEKRKEEESRREQAEAYSTKLRKFISLARQSLERNFTAVLANKAQELASILSHFETDIRNIAHDAKYAFGEVSNTVDDLLLALDSISNKDDSFEKEILFKTRQLALDVEMIVASMRHVISDLRQFSQIDGSIIDIADIIKQLEFSEEENYRKKYIQYQFIYSDGPVYIKCNSWHLKSIIKNIIYNSNNALMKLHLKDKNFFGIISTTYYRKGNQAYIEFKDNGPGIQDAEVLSKLYESDEKLHSGLDNVNGNGSIIVQQYLELHGGRVLCKESSAEGGLKIILTFDITED